MYLTSARRLAETMDDPGFYTAAKKAVDTATSEGPAAKTPK
jgi:hypothetical protein